jgi:DNA mismatch endonuclease Vsr
MDKLTKEQRSKNMKAIRNKDSKIERTLRQALWSKGYRYRKNYRKLIGCPDIVFTKYKVAIFCDSEFWHGYNWDERKKDIKSNQEFWINKIESNIARDEYVTKQLEDQGYTVLRFWGNEIQKKTLDCANVIIKTIEKKSK